MNGNGRRRYDESGAGKSFNRRDRGNIAAGARMVRQHSQLEQAQGAQVIGAHQRLNRAHASFARIERPTDYFRNRAQRIGQRRPDTGSG
jgi:hypothetical protein